MASRLFINTFFTFVSKQIKCWKYMWKSVGFTLVATIFLCWIPIFMFDKGVEQEKTFVQLPEVWNFFTITQTYKYTTKVSIYLFIRDGLQCNQRVCFVVGFEIWLILLRFHILILKYFSFLISLISIVTINNQLLIPVTSSTMQYFYILFVEKLLIQQL